MKVLKFGGTSVGNADRMLDVGNIVREAAAEGRVGLVVSAVTGVTNHLIGSVTDVLAGKPVAESLAGFRQTHAAILEDLARKVEGGFLEIARQEIAAVAAEFEDLLNGVRLLRECPVSILDHISSLGERASTPIIASILRNLGLTVFVIDPREFIITDNVFGDASPLMPQIEKRFERILGEQADVFLMPGFFGATTGGKTTTLGRGGSDYSAAIMAAALKARCLEIWTDVNGVFSADPKVVPEAFVLSEMSYPEAMELAFFGAKVLHPRTIAPVVAQNIPTLIKNTFHPRLSGTLIHAHPADSPWGVRGLSTLDKVAMIGISGAGLRGVAGVAARVFSTMARAGISAILIAQASSEYSLCFCVSDRQAGQAVESLEAEFALERKAELVDQIETATGLAILSVVGDQMRFRRGIAGSFFSALAAADVNVVAIAQGFSERSISAVIAQADARRAIRATHQFFFDRAHGIQVFVVGTGLVGKELLGQIRQQRAALREQQVDIRVCGVANSRRAIFQPQGVDLDTWEGQLHASDQPFQLEALLEEIRKERFLNPVFVDCSGSQQVAESYLGIFEAGLHLVTPSKIANSGSLAYYSDLRATANRRRRRFLYSTNVGASLPIIETLKNMMKSGDRLQACQGILSGSMSFIFGLLEQGIPFSEALSQARAKGFTEPDPRDDLSGLDVARKILVLGREAGLRLELRDVTVVSPLPPEFDTGGTAEEFLKRSHHLDRYFQEKIDIARRKGATLRFLGRIEGGRCEVGIVEVLPTNPLFAVRDGENAVSFLTDRYHPIPLVVRGYGAGPEVTAAGVFADVLRTVTWNTETTR